tara:strand:+ start:1441 stop:2031 length:591 start_codon:yes stop_codon:yes gene_type:complete
MEEVQPNNLEVGKDYYIEMVGRYSKYHRQSGKAIGKGFIKTITFGEIVQQQGYDAIICGIDPGCFDDPDIFVQFREVVPVNPYGRACGICNYQFYPATFDTFNTMTREQQRWSCGGYKFFKIKKKELMKRITNQVMDKDHPGMAAQPSMDSGLGVKSNVAGFMGGKKRRRKSRRKTHRKTRKTKRKSPKRKTKKGR